MNLLWDESALNKGSYFRFLAAVCRFGDQGLSSNQENLYYLYEKYNTIRMLFYCSKVYE